jgi:hypothetical protein
MPQTHTAVDARGTRTLPPARRIVVVAGAALIVIGALADVYSIAHHLPYAFGGHGDPDRVRQEWTANGTALGPPLMPLIVLVLFTPLAIARQWWGGVAEVFLILVALAELVGTVGEPTMRTVFEPGSIDVVQILFRLTTLAATLTLFLAACADLRLRFARRREG